MPGHRPLVLIGSQIERLPEGDFVQLGKLNIGPPELITVIASTIDVSSSHIEVTAVSPEIVLTIDGGETSDILFIHGQIGTAKVTFNTGGNLILTKKRDILGPSNILLLLRENAVWYEVSWNG